MLSNCILLAPRNLGKVCIWLLLVIISTQSMSNRSPFRFVLNNRPTIQLPNTPQYLPLFCKNEPISVFTQKDGNIMFFWISARAPYFFSPNPFIESISNFPIAIFSLLPKTARISANFVCDCN